MTNRHIAVAGRRQNSHANAFLPCTSRFILSHPDYYRRPRNFTGSADPEDRVIVGRSRASQKSGLPPVGIYTLP